MRRALGVNGPTRRVAGLSTFAALGVLAVTVALAVASPVYARRVATHRPVSVLRGNHYGARIFPDNFFTVRDHSEVTGERVHFRLGVDYPSFRGSIHPRCTSADYSICDAFAELNTLDGFDTNPQVTVPFTGPIRLRSVTAKDFFISDQHGHFASGLRQLTFDPATNTLAGIADAFLREDTTYEIHVTSGIRDTHGRPINACGGSCVVRFTTETASGELVRIRKSMDLPLSSPSNAYVLARFPNASKSTASRRLTFIQHGKADVFRAASVVPSVANPLNGIVRTDQIKANPKAKGAFQSSAVPNLIQPQNAGYYAFGSFLSPRYQYASASGHVDNRYGVGNGFTDGEIPPVPTKETPKPFGYDRIGAIVVTPDPTRFPRPGRSPSTALGSPGATMTSSSPQTSTPQTEFSRSQQTRRGMGTGP